MEIKALGVFCIFAFLLASAHGDGTDPARVPARLANGVVIEGTIVEVSARGMVIRTAQGSVTYPWRYLSAGTRYRYQRDDLFADTVEEPAAAGDDSDGPPADNDSSSR